jgi:hypothetical protein
MPITQLYWFWCINLSCNQLVDIIKTKLSHKLSVFLPYKRLSKSICRHLCCRAPLHMESPLLYFLSYPHLMGVHVPQLCVKPLILFLNYANCLLIVAVDRRLDLWVKLDMLEDSDPLLYLSTCS